MKKKSLIVCAVMLLLSATVAVHAAPSKRKPRRSARPPDGELRELLRRTEQIVEQAQAEASRARQQSEELQRRLEENTSELARLRQAIADYGSRIAELKSEGPHTKPATEPVQPGQSVQPAQTEQSAIRDPQSAIEERLDRLQEQVEVHTEQIREHAQTKVESDSKFRVRLFGMILANTYFNTNDSSLSDVPLSAPPPGSIVRKNNFGAMLRQTRIGLAMQGPRLAATLGEARLSAEAEFDFWGGTGGRADGDVLGSLRVITASARLDWERTALVVGQRQPLVSPLNPTSIAAAWFPPLAGAGNLWQWRPQITLEHRARVDDSSELIVQGGLMTPFGESLQGVPIEGGPGYESRVAFRRNLDSDKRVEFGFGGYIHRRPFSLDRHVNSFAFTGDWVVPLGGRVELSGEAFYGQAITLGERGGSRNDRLFAVSGPLDSPATTIRGVHSAGGWAQLAIKARPDLDFNFAYGQEDPRNRDLSVALQNPATRLKNQVASANFIWQLRHNFLVSLEYRRLWTRYPAREQTSNHYNLAVGYVF
ncbi:MAG TPA: hypothetical protein VFD58_34445 [Blastocatellia bacterium]|nr:hypothetical protein [Blastocatellia bacterium]